MVAPVWSVTRPLMLAELTDSCADAIAAVKASIKNSFTFSLLVQFWATRLSRLGRRSLEEREFGSRPIRAWIWRALKNRRLWSVTDVEAAGNEGGLR